MDLFTSIPGWNLHLAMDRNRGAHNRSVGAKAGAGAYRPGWP